MRIARIALFSAPLALVFSFACGGDDESAANPSDEGGAADGASLDGVAADTASDSPISTGDSGSTSGLPASAFGLNYTASRFDGSVPNNPWPPPNVTPGSIRAWDNGTAWRDLEPMTQGTFVFSNLDAMHALVVAAGIDDFEYTAGMTPAWAASVPTQTGCHGDIAGSCSPPSDVNSAIACTTVPDGGTGDCAWKEYIYNLFTHVTVGGKSWIRKFSPWNEFNTVNEFWTEASPYPMLARLAQDAYVIIKKIDPTVTIFTPSTTSTGGPTKMCAYLGGASQPGQYADALNFHTYLTVSQEFPPEDVLARLEQYRGCLTTNGLTGLPIYSDEGGWGENPQTNLPNSQNPDCPQDGGCMNASSDAASAFIARYYLLQLFWGIKGFWWYGSGADEWGSLGTLSADGVTYTPLADATAYSQVHDWLVGSRLGDPCTNGDAGTVWVCDLTRDVPSGYSARAVWDTSGNSSYANPKPSTWNHYRDLTGASHTISGAIPIGIMPVLIEP